MKYVFIAVEGQHDISFLYRFLKRNGFVKNIKKSIVDEYWQRLIPNQFPVNDDLLKRVPLPRFFSRSDVSIAIYDLIGISGVKSCLEILSTQVDVSKIHSIGLFFDADDVTPIKRFQSIVNDINSLSNQYIRDSLSALSKPGITLNTGIITGIYIFPDNSKNGTLDHILCNCAKCSYDDLFQPAKTYIDAVAAERRAKWAPNDELKALIGCIANVLKPGKANQVSIEDDNWVCDDSLTTIPELKSVEDFMLQLF